EILIEMAGVQGMEGVVVDGDGVHGTLPENVKNLLRDALGMESTAKTRASLVRREAYRTSHDLCRSLKFSCISRSELLEHVGWSSEETITFLERCVLYSAARLAEEVGHQMALKRYTEESGSIGDLSVDDYLELCSQAERKVRERLSDALSDDRKRYERMQRFVALKEIAEEEG
nr:hypothetical protein [bacterium]